MLSPECNKRQKLCVKIIHNNTLRIQFQNTIANLCDLNVTISVEILNFNLSENWCCNIVCQKLKAFNFNGNTVEILNALRLTYDVVSRWADLDSNFLLVSEIS